MIVDIVSQMVAGLEFLHSLKVIHRDLKPSNVLINLTEEFGVHKITLKIIDFSISKVVADHGVNILSDLFSTGKIDLDSDRLTKNVTTRPYRAPEVALMNPYTLKIDLWALGCICAELLLCATTSSRQILFAA